MSRFKELISQFQLELRCRKYADSTISTYTSCLAVFLRAMNGKQKPLPLNEVKMFLATIKNQNYHKQFTATIHHFYKLVLKQPLSLQDIPYPRPTHYLPQILSVEETFRLFAAVKNIKHLAILKTIYTGALRISEVTKIICRKGLSHIDADRKTLLVKGAKGYKDRYVHLPAETIQLLRSYFKQYNPKYWLFEGQTGDKYSTRSIQHIFKRACKAAGINKQVTPHCLRHSRATHLLETGGEVDIYKLKELLGHNNIKTTEIYLHLSTKSLIDCIERADEYINKCFNKELLLEMAA